LIINERFCNDTSADPRFSGTGASWSLHSILRFIRLSPGTLTSLETLSFVLPRHVFLPEVRIHPSER